MSQEVSQTAVAKRVANIAYGHFLHSLTIADEIADRVKRVDRSDERDETGDGERGVRNKLVRSGENGRDAIFDCIHRMLPAHVHFFQSLETVIEHLQHTLDCSG